MERRRPPLSTHPQIHNQAAKKTPKNGELINTISALITEHLADFRSEVITMINKKRDKLVSLGNKESYNEGFDTTDQQKTKTKL